MSEEFEGLYVSSCLITYFNDNNVQDKVIASPCGFSDCTDYCHECIASKDNRGVWLRWVGARSENYEFLKKVGDQQ